MPGNVLKLIGAFCMLIDHIGLLFFPDQIWMRAVGRIAFPIFAFFIAEGFLYTRSRIRYLFTVLSIGALCQVVYFVAQGELYLCVLITFSFSISLLFLLDKALQEVRRGGAERWLYIAAFGVALIAVAVICYFVEVDYGLCGIMLPLWPHFAQTKRGRLGAFACGLVPLCVSGVLEGAPVQLFAFLALVPLALYNGKPGKPRLKFFFYVFYPAHLALLWGIQYLLG